METINVRNVRGQISRILDRVQAGEEVTIIRRGKPAAQIVAPQADPVQFQPRAALRDQVPPMEQPAESEVRWLRDDERYFGIRV